MTKSELISRILLGRALASMFLLAIVISMAFTPWSLAPALLALMCNEVYYHKLLVMIKENDIHD